VLLAISMDCGMSVEEDRAARERNIEIESRSMPIEQRYGIEWRYFYQVSLNIWPLLGKDGADGFGNAFLWLFLSIIAPYLQHVMKYFVSADEARQDSASPFFANPLPISRDQCQASATLDLSRTSRDSTSPLRQPIRYFR
jgi:hypothetical protein